VQELMKAARVSPVPASRQVLAEIPEMGFQLWALGRTSDVAMARLVRIVAQQVTPTKRQMASGRRGER
jgi:hypothetical protein